MLFNSVLSPTYLAIKIVCVCVCDWNVKKPVGKMLKVFPQIMFSYLVF